MSGKPEEGGAPKGEKFRKPDWARPGAGPVPEGGVPAAPGDAAARELVRAMRPFEELARAFRESTKAIQGIAEGQERIVRRLERTDRSEAVIRSTKALNETFRGVKLTQEELLDRLEKERKRPYLLALAVLLLVVGLGGGTLAVFLGALDRRESAAREDRADTLGRILADKNARLDEITAELDRRAGELADRKAREADLRSRIEALRGERERLARENEGLLADREELSRAVREKAALAADNAERLRQITALQGRVEELTRKLAASRAEVEELTRRLAGTSRPASAGTAASPAEAVPGPGAGPRRRVPAGAVTDAGEIARILLHLNRLLAEGGEGDRYRFARIGGVRGKVLYDVVVVSGEGEAKRIEAAECRVVLDEAQRRAELRFRNGHLSLYGARAPFWGGKYVVPVVSIDPAAWLDSGLTFIDRLL